MKTVSTLIAFAMLVACSAEEIQTPELTNTRHYTYKSIAGVSMGGGAAAYLALSQPEKWDTIGILGAPLIDQTSMNRMVERSWLGGFCSYETMTGFIEAGKNLNSEETYCGLYTQQPGANLLAERAMVPTDIVAEDAERPMEFISDYNNWWRGPNGGRGGSFNRISLMKALLDIQKGFGNTLYETNTDVAWAAPGVTEEWLAQTHEDKCANPVVLENYFNAEFNPEGTFPVITFCEGEESDDNATLEGQLGRITPESNRWYSMPGLLAVDYNRNGVRDYSEPVIVNARERFDDFGIDALPDDLEEGYDAVTNPDPAGDNYDYFRNPSGTEGNYQFDNGESFADFGLDGVADTGDHGEDDNTFTQSQAVDHAIAYDPRHLLNQLSADELGRLNIYMDAGIRDFLNTAVGSNAFFAHLKTKVPQDFSSTYNEFSELALDGEDFDPSMVPADKVNQYTYIRYGNLDASAFDIAQGDGNHVGTANQVLDRMLSAMSIAQLQWPDTNLSTKPSNPIGDPAYANTDSYESATLGKTKEFSYLLPPGYFDPENADETYPVFFFLHGQGQKHRDLLGASLIMLSNMVESQSVGVSKWAKFITIFPDGKCESEVCDKGNFWVDFASGKSDERFYTDFYELVDVVDERFRTRAPEDIEIP